MSSYQEFEHPFYGKEIVRADQQAYISQILNKYKNHPVNEDLKKLIWDELQMEKYKGHITIPFKVILKRDATGTYPSYIEIVLDTKV